MSAIPSSLLDGIFNLVGEALGDTSIGVMRETREDEERFRMAAEVGKIFAYDWDAITDFIERSGESARVLDVNESTPITHQELLVGVHQDDREKLKSAIAELSPDKPNLQISYRRVHPDGTVVWVERKGQAYFDRRGKLLRVVGMVADITERKLAEEAIARFSGRLIEAHEEERTWIARELHDDIVQRLALLAIDLEQTERSLTDSRAEIRNHLREQLKRVHGISADIQALSHRLHSSKLRYLGIVVAARSFCQELAEQLKLKIGFTHTNIPATLPEEISLCLFRVMQEALHNAVKYSGVKNFEVELRGAPDGIYLTVRDGGLGFDPEEMRNIRGLGLISMQERVNLVKGVFLIDSQPDHGTTIRVRLPLSSRNEPAPTARD
jgi:signal transduction histidine kinase